MAKEAGARCVETQASLERATAAWASEASEWRARAEYQGARLEEQAARLKEQGARIEALNEEWASVQGELSMVERRLQAVAQEKRGGEERAERQISQLQEDLNAYIGESDQREAEHAQAVETMQAAYRQVIE